MHSNRRRVLVSGDYPAEARRLAGAGRPVSAVLLRARAILEMSGWTPRRSARPGAGLDVLTAIRVAARSMLGANLQIADHYVFLVPIAAVVRSSFAQWESQAGLELPAVLAMLDAAIAFALDAERSDERTVIS